MTPIGLSASLTKLKQTVPMDLLGSPTYDKGPVYTAAYEAYYEANKPMKVENDPDDTTGNLKSKADSASNDLDKKIKENAELFAKTFCTNLGSDFTDIILDAIDSHIKNAMISVSLIIPANGALACGVGPVTGNITAGNLTPAGPTGGISIS